MKKLKCKIEEKVVGTAINASQKFEPLTNTITIELLYFGAGPTMKEKPNILGVD